MIGVRVDVVWERRKKVLARAGDGKHSLERLCRKVVILEAKSRWGVAEVTALIV